MDKLSNREISLPIFSCDHYVEVQDLSIFKYMDYQLYTQLKSYPVTFSISVSLL